MKQPEQSVFAYCRYCLQLLPTAGDGFPKPPAAFCNVCAWWICSRCEQSGVHGCTLSRREAPEPEEKK